MKWKITSLYSLDPWLAVVSFSLTLPWSLSPFSIYLARPFDSSFRCSRKSCAPNLSLSYTSHAQSWPRRFVYWASWSSSWSTLDMTVLQKALFRWQLCTSPAPSCPSLRRLSLLSIFHLPCPALRTSFLANLPLWRAQWSPLRPSDYHFQSSVSAFGFGWSAIWAWSWIARSTSSQWFFHW